MPKSTERKSEHGTEQTSGLNAYQLAEARAKFTTLVNQAASAGRRSVINKFGRPAAALVPIQDLYRLMDADQAALEHVVRDDSESVQLVPFSDLDEPLPVVASQAELDARSKFEQLGALVAEIMSLDVVRDYVKPKLDRRPATDKRPTSSARSKHGTVSEAQQR